MRKFMSFVMLVAFLNLLALGGLAAYAVATGRLDGAKAAVMLDLVKHPGTPEKLRENVAELLEPPPAATSTAPATQAQLVRLDDGSLSTVASAMDRIEKVQQAMEKERLKLDQEARNLLARQKLLDDLRLDLERRVAQLETDRAAFEKHMETVNNQQADENFATTLALYGELKPRQVKEIFITLEPELVARYVRAMEADKATKVIGEFKNEDERKFIAGVLELIRQPGTDSAKEPEKDPATPAANAAAAGQARS